MPRDPKWYEGSEDLTEASDEVGFSFNFGEAKDPAELEGPERYSADEVAGMDDPEGGDGAGPESPMGTDSANA